MRTFAYVRPADADAARAALADPGARPMGGGTDLLTQQDRGIRPASAVVDLRGVGLAGIESADGVLRIGATTTVAVFDRYEGFS
jgi:CO/xanthine dehydrogenase FAD-binding subunit